MTEPILLAYHFDGQGGAQSLTPDAIGQHLKGETDTLTWVHLDANQKTTKQWLKKEMASLDPVVIDALLAEETRPRMMQVDQGLLLILRGVNLNDQADPEDMISIRLWVDAHRIISIRRRRLQAVRDLEAKSQQGQAPKDAGSFLCMLISGLFDKVEPVLLELDDTTDLLEEQILENGDISLRESIVDIRRKAILFRRYMAPQRDAIYQLHTAPIAWLKKPHKRYLQEIYDRVTRHVEDLDEIRERAQVVKDELTSLSAERLNRNTYVLSVIAAIFLPLGFLTGLLGINVGGIPGANNAHAFTIFCAILAVIVAGQIIVFKRLKWF